VGYFGILSFVIGALTFFVRPELLDEITGLIKDIVGEDELVFGFSSVFLLFLNNFRAVLISVFGGIVLGVLPLFTIGVNFFSLGFIFALFAFGGASLGTGSLQGVALYLVAILPHGILELPVLLVAGGLGLKFGFFWTKPNKDVGIGRNFILVLKEIAWTFPLLVFLLLLAALLEIFVTGNLLAWIIK
jgi:stage II sporulation protein M